MEKETLQEKEFDLTFLKSPRFWFIGVAALATVLLEENFRDIPWNKLLGQFLQIWAAGAAGIGLIDRTVDKLVK